MDAALVKLKAEKKNDDFRKPRSSTTTTQAALVLTRVFDASPEQVFRLWSDPERVKEVVAPEGLHDAGLRDGLSRRRQLPLLRPLGQARRLGRNGTYQEIDAPRPPRLQLPVGRPATRSTDTATIISIDFAPTEGDKTLIDVSARVPFASIAAARQPRRRLGHQVLDAFRGIRSAEGERVIRLSAFRWVPPFAQGLVRDLRVRWALEEAGLPYEVMLIGPEEQKSDSYRKLQAFRPGGRRSTTTASCCSSPAPIVMHLGERSEVLMPRDAPARARVRTWMLAALNTIEPPITSLIVIDPPGPAGAPRPAPRICATRSSPGSAAGSTAWAAFLGDREKPRRGPLQPRPTCSMTTVLRILRTTDLVSQRPTLEAYRFAPRGEAGIPESARRAGWRRFAETCAAGEDPSPDYFGRTNALAGKAFEQPCERRFRRLGREARFSRACSAQGSFLRGPEFDRRETTQGVIVEHRRAPRSRTGSVPAHAACTSSSCTRGRKWCCSLPCRPPISGFEAPRSRRHRRATDTVSEKGARPTSSGSRCSEHTPTSSGGRVMRRVTRPQRQAPFQGQDARRREPSPSAITCFRRTARGRSACARISLVPAPIS